MGFIVLTALGRKLWFTADEWDFIVNRGFHHPALGWMVPHNEHWSALPIVMWRVLFTVVGLHHYWPYLMVVTLAHLLAVHALWRIAGRLAIDSWLATAIAAATILLGIGYQNLDFAFQIGFVGSVAFGMVAILLCLELRGGWRQGPRLYVVWAVAILGLTCSGIGVTMVIGATLVTLVVRGPAPAILVASLPAVVYAGWYERWGKDGVSGNTFGVNSTNYHQVPDFIANGFSTTLSGWLDFDNAGPVVLALLILIAATRHWRGVQAVPLALLLTSGIFFASTAAGRIGLGVAEAAASRYSYIAMFLLLPAILVGLDLLVKRGGLAVPVGLAIFLAVTGAVRINTHESVTSTSELADRALFVADATLLRTDVPVVATTPVADDPGLTPAAMKELDGQGQLSGFRPATAVELAQAHFDLQIATSPTQVVSDRPPALGPTPTSTVFDRVNGCASVTPNASGGNVVLTVGADTSAVAITAGAPTAIGISLMTPGLAAVGPDLVPFALGTTWLRVSDPGSTVTLTFPVGTFQVCHVGIAQG